MQCNCGRQDNAYLSKDVHDLWIGKQFIGMIELEGLNGEISLDYSGDMNEIMRVLIRGRQECQNQR